MSTTKVIEWLKFYNAPYIRINDTDYVEIIRANLDAFVIKLGDNVVDSNNIISYWYRKGRIRSKKYLNASVNSEDLVLGNLTNALIEHEEIELSTIIEYIYYILEKHSNKIGSRFVFNVNKLEILDLARQCGLEIPHTQILSKDDNVFPANCKLISKPLFKPFNFFYEKLSLATFTEEVYLKPQFQPSLIQELVEKEYEIRVFYLKRKLYSMAIFSQNDNQTKIDFRKYNTKKPNRFVPYKLPQKIELSLIKLMDKINLNCGSIDLIKSTDGKYYFLEVNPVGQFGMVSYPCNYQLEQIIAKELITDIVKNEK